MRQLLWRAVKFGLTGVMGAALAYLLFIVCLRFMNYIPATVIAWAGSIAFGFLANRRFTFGLKGRPGRSRQAVLYTVGALMQLALALTGYALMLGQLHWQPTPAFLVNTAVMATFGFAYQSLATFRRRAQVGHESSKLSGVG